MYRILNIEMFHTQGSKLMKKHEFLKVGCRYWVYEGVTKCSVESLVKNKSFPCTKPSEFEPNGTRSRSIVFQTDGELPSHKKQSQIFEPSI